MFKFECKEDVATKQGDETLVYKSGIAKLSPKVQAFRVEINSDNPARLEHLKSL